MKWMIASDIHGAAGFCRQMLEAFREEKADRLLLLGDLLYHGPRNSLPEGYDPKKVIALLNGAKEKLFCVRGNCEAEVDQMVLEFPVLADFCLLEAAGHTVHIGGNIGHPRPSPQPGKPALPGERGCAASWAHPRACQDGAGRLVVCKPGIGFPAQGGQRPGIYDTGKGRFHLENVRRPGL